MGDTAASGGYYVSAPASFIMSQRSTITGSIGVITAKIATAGGYVPRRSTSWVSRAR